MTRPWYGRSWAVLATLVLCPPLGLCLMWRHSGWERVTRWIVVATLGIAVFAAFSPPAAGTGSSAARPAPPQQAPAARDADRAYGSSDLRAPHAHYEVADGPSAGVVGY